MSRQNLWTPITIVVAGLVIIVITLVSPGLNTSARPQIQQNTRTATRTATATRTTTATTTATDQSPTPQDTTVTTSTVTVITGTLTPDSATMTSAPTLTNVPTIIDVPTVTSTPTLTPSATATPPTVFPTAERFRVEEESTPVVTPTPSNEIACLPGSPLEITGEGPPRAAFLLYFNQRAVGGGSVGRNGQFMTRLVVGTERPGRYEVAVRVRDTREVLLELTCIVPELAPPRPASTPTVIP